MPPCAFAAETPVTAAELTNLIKGKTVYIGNDYAVYEVDGSYSYVSRFGQISRGKYTVSQGQICVQFTSSNRCDSIVRDESNLTLITKGGQRAAMRP